MSDETQTEERETEEQREGPQFGSRLEFDERLLQSEDDGILHQDNMKAKKEPEGGEHPTSTSLGKVVSDAETDGAGLTPQKMAQRADERSTATVDSSESQDKDDNDNKDDDQS